MSASPDDNPHGECRVFDDSYGDGMCAGCGEREHEGNHDKGGNDGHPCPRCGRRSITHRWCATCGKSWTGHDEMEAAMNREPDPATDKGYGPRAVND